MSLLPIVYSHANDILPDRTIIAQWKSYMTLRILRFLSSSIQTGATVYPPKQLGPNPLLPH